MNSKDGRLITPPTMSGAQSKANRIRRGDDDDGMKWINNWLERSWPIFVLTCASSLSNRQRAEIRVRLICHEESQTHVCLLGGAGNSHGQNGLG
jgi:hypothetical protein